MYYWFHQIPWALLKLLQNLKLFKFLQNPFQINQIETFLKRKEKEKNRKKEERPEGADSAQAKLPAQAELPAQPS
jgi:hypothetical protein